MENIEEGGANDDPGTSTPPDLEYAPEAVVGRNVARLRDERGWTQTVLAERLASYGFQLHQSTIAKAEAGKRPIRVNELVALASVFNVTLGELLPVEPGASSDQDERAVMAREIAQAQADFRGAQEQFQRDAAAADAAAVRLAEATARRDDAARRLVELKERFWSDHG